MGKGIYVRTKEMKTGKYLKTEEHRKKLGKSHIGNKYSLGRNHSEETRRKISKNNGKGMLGKHHTEESKRKMSKTAIIKYENGYVSPSKGRVSWNKGLTKETDDRVNNISESRLKRKDKIGYLNSPETIRKHKETMRKNPYKHSEEIKRKIRETSVVHHKDGNHFNDVPENRMIMSQSEHIKLHWRQGDMAYPLVMNVET